MSELTVIHSKSSEKETNRQMLEKCQNYVRTVSERCRKWQLSIQNLLKRRRTDRRQKIVRTLSERCQSSSFSCQIDPYIHLLLSEIPILAHVLSDSPSLVKDFTVRVPCMVILVVVRIPWYARGPPPLGIHIDWCITSQKHLDSNIVCKPAIFSTTLFFWFW